MTELRSPDGLGPLVLVVDDHAGLRDVAARRLREGGYDVVAVGTAAEALTLLGVVRVAAVLSDFGMPSMNGVGLLHALRSAGNMTPFVLWSVDLPTEAAQRAESLGARIADKRDMTTLLAIIEQALNESLPPPLKATPSSDPRDGRRSSSDPASPEMNERVPDHIHTLSSRRSSSQ
jgi:CheY-like chemotaxis protein